MVHKKPFIQERQGFLPVSKKQGEALFVLKLSIYIHLKVN